MSRQLVNLACLLGLLVAAGRANAKPQEIFNGKDLTGWDGDPKVWSVEDGAIVGRTTAEAPIEQNTFLIRRKPELRDFRLRFEYQIEGGNSGVQYRSRIADPKKWVIHGYQADIDSGPTYTGILYEEGLRGILAERGTRVRIDADGKKEVERFADGEALNKKINTGGWNKYLVEAQGNSLRHTINGELMSETHDAEREKRADSGVLALQVHAGPPMTIRFRKMALEPLPRKGSKPTP